MRSGVFSLALRRHPERSHPPWSIGRLPPAIHTICPQDLPSTAFGSFFARCHYGSIVINYLLCWFRYPRWISLFSFFFVQILDISLYVSDMWTNDIDSEKLVALEQKFVHHHQYIASLLRTDAAHSMLPQGKYQIKICKYNFNSSRMISISISGHLDGRLDL